MDAQIEAACRYYDDRYDIVFQHMWQSHEKRELREYNYRLCRFCKRSEPEVTFKNVAHAVPEALGNRGLTSNYECDACNSHFGSTIETDLGEWTKPARTFARIRGKNGIPTIKKGPEKAWRIEYKDDQLVVKNYTDDPIVDIDEENKRIILTLRRGAYTPIGVYKAFVKIGLTLMPETEMSPFHAALGWLQERDHAKNWVHGATIIHTFQNGPMPPDKLFAMILRRKPGVTDVPYAYLILGFGNDAYQVMLPSPTEDQHLSGDELSIVPFPTPGGPDPMKYGRAMPKAIDLTSSTRLKGESVPIGLGFDQVSRVQPPKAAT